MGVHALKSGVSSPENDLLGAVERRAVPDYGLGGMTERTKVLVLKTSEAQASVGSNPTPSAAVTPLQGDTVAGEPQEKSRPIE